MNLQDALNLFIRDSLIYGKSESTIVNYKNAISCLFTATHSLSQFVSLNEITSEEINNIFIEGITEKHWGRFTSWTYHKNLKAFFNWAKKKQFITVNPLDEVTRPRLIRQPPKSISEFEVKELLYFIENYKYPNNFIKVRNITILKTFIFTGIRKNELLNLKVQEIDLDSDFITINNGKGGKSREVPIEKIILRPSLVKYINLRRRYYGKSGWLFKGDPIRGHSDQKRLSEDVLKRIFSLLSHRLHKRMYAHRLRHTFATLLLEKTGDLFMLKELLGHSSIKTTCIYLSTTRNKKTEAINKMKLF